VLNYAASQFLASSDCLCFDGRVAKCAGVPVARGLFIGDDSECFHRAAELSFQVNLALMPAPAQGRGLSRPREFHSTWLGNKAIYRTRMALENGGELIVLAPGVREFGEIP